MPERNLPFFEMFAKYHPAPALAAQLETWLVTGAVMDSHSRTIEVKLLCTDLPAPALLDQVGREVSQIYGLRGVTFRPACPQAPAGAEGALAPPTGRGGCPAAPRGCRRPPMEEAVPPAWEAPPSQRWSRPLSLRNRQVGGCRSGRGPLPAGKTLPPDRGHAAAEAMKAAMAAHKEARGFSTQRIYGTRQIKKAPKPMNTLELDMGVVTVEGDVFAVEHRELKKRNAWVISFDITDYTSSIRVSKFMPGDEGTPIVNGVKVGMHLKISGRLNLNRFDNDMVLEP